MLITVRLHIQLKDHRELQKVVGSQSVADYISEIRTCYLLILRLTLYPTVLISRITLANVGRIWFISICTYLFVTNLFSLRISPSLLKVPLSSNLKLRELFIKSHRSLLHKSITFSCRHLIWLVFAKMIIIIY